MAMNFSQMLGSLRMGVDVLPLTDPDAVPHTKKPGYIPKYTLREENGTVISREPVDVLVAQAHGFLGTVCLYEDEHPVFCVEY